VQARFAGALDDVDIESLAATMRLLSSITTDDPAG
jgi:hypothetical protein